MKSHVTGKSVAALPCPHCKHDAAVPTKLEVSSIFDTNAIDPKGFKLYGEQDDWNREQYPYVICKCECLNCDALSYAKIAISINIEDAITGVAYRSFPY